MERLGEILARVVDQEALGRKVRHGPVFQRWSHLVGPLLAQKCWPVSVRKGVLLVRVAGPVWMQELQLQKQELLQRVAQVAGPKKIVDIRFTVRGAKAAARTRAMASAEDISPARALSQEEMDWVEQTVEGVNDPGLRAVVRRILERHVRTRSKG
jgi:predicted nucleic acid-binding Zn ribbon protein